MIRQIAIAALCAMALPAQAATFNAEFWDVDPVQFSGNTFGSFSDPFDFKTDVLDVVATPADLTFTVGTLDFPNESLVPTADTLDTVDTSGPSTNGIRAETARLNEFLGSEAGGVDSDDSNPVFVAGSIFRFSGLIDVNAGINSFTVQSDDGFQLSLDGIVQPGSATAPRGFGSTTIDFVSPATETIAFELIYYDSGVVRAGLFVTKDGALLKAVQAPNVVPLPASGLLLLGGLAGAAALARRRRR